MSAHTPGPWEIIPQNDGSAMIAHKFDTGRQINPTGLRLIANVMARRNSLPEDEANARLIAAAPDMYAYVASRSQSGEFANMREELKRERKIKSDLVAALQAITLMCEGYQGHPIGNDQRTKDARASLAKATGEV